MFVTAEDSAAASAAAGDGGSVPPDMGGAACDIITVFASPPDSAVLNDGAASFSASGSDEEQETERVQLRRSRHRFDAERVFALHPALRRLPLAEILFAAFGPRAVGAVTSVYLLVKGVVAHLLTAIMLPLFQVVFRTSQGEYQNFLNVALMAWSAKPIIGLLSDVCPIAGYHKRSYMAIAAVLCAASCLVIAALPAEAPGGGRGRGSASFLPSSPPSPSASPSPSPASSSVVISGAQAATLCLFVANMGCATLDLLTEGKYSELMTSRPETGAALVSWAWGCAMVGGAVAAIFEGPMADAGATAIRAVLVAAAGIVLLSSYPTLRNWFAERRVRVTIGAAASAKMRQHGRVVAYGALMAVLVTLLAIVALFHTRRAQLMVLVVITSVLSVSSFWCLPPIVAKANLFMFLKEALYVQIPGPLDYFFTADSSCVADGPHFDYTYYQTFTAIVGYLAGGLGVWLFHQSASHRGFRAVFVFTTCVKILSSVFDVVMIERWNTHIFGVPDKLFYFLGDAIIASACSMIDFMPAVVLTAKLAPKGMESTMYALLAGFSNFGQSASRSIGYLLSTDVLPVHLDGGKGNEGEAGAVQGCEYSNLSTLVVVAHLAIPLLTFPLIFILVPNKRLSESLVDTDAGASLSVVRDHHRPPQLGSDGEGYAGSDDDEADDDEADDDEAARRGQMLQ